MAKEMKYSEIKARLKLLKKHDYSKMHGWPVWIKTFKLENWNIQQCISNHDIVYTKQELESFLDYLEEKNLRILFESFLDEKKRMG